MTKFAALFWLGLVLASGFATFTVKYAVQGVDEQVRQTRRQIVADEEQIRVLTAEWNYLNRPARLAALNQRFLQLAPISTTQLEQRIEDIAFWAPPVAATEPPASPPPVAAVVAGRPSAAPAPPVGLPITAAAYNRGTPADALTRLVREAGRGEPSGERADQDPRSLDALFAQIAEAR